MRKLLFFSLLLIAITANAQIFNTSSTLNPKTFSLGVEPGFYINGSSEFGLFLHGGIGITKSADFALKIGILGDENYIGGDVEFAMGKRFSLAVGAHTFYDFGLDGTALFTFPLTKGASIFTGLDTDIIFADDLIVPLWLPVGLQIGVKKGTYFIFESEINLTDNSYNYLGGGLSFIF